MLTCFYQTSSLDVQHIAQSLGDAIDQNKIVHRVMDAIHSLIHEQHPEASWSDASKGV